MPSLRALHTAYGVRAVVTIPDKPSGRGLKVHESAVKQEALRLGVPHLLQPPSLKDTDFLSAISALEPDIICVIAFRILPSAVYSLASLGAFNVHASLLPKFRGAAPINHAIMNGDKETGVTSFLLNDVVDTGTILLQEVLPIDEDMTAGELYEALMPLAASCAVNTVSGLLAGALTPSQQDDTLASPAPKIWRDECRIDWHQPAKKIRNLIRGVSPVPCAWTLWNNERVKIFRSEFSSKVLQPGTWKMSDESWSVGCAEGSIALTEIQLPGKPIVKTLDFLRGWRGEREGEFA